MIFHFVKIMDDLELFHNNHTKFLRRIPQIIYKNMVPPQDADSLPCTRPPSWGTRSCCRKIGESDLKSDGKVYSWHLYDDFENGKAKSSVVIF